VTGERLLYDQTVFRLEVRPKRQKVLSHRFLTVSSGCHLYSAFIVKYGGEVSRDASVEEQMQPARLQVDVREIELLIVGNQSDALVEAGEGPHAHLGEGSVGTDEELRPDGDHAVLVLQMNDVFPVIWLEAIEAVAAHEMGVALGAEPVVQLTPRGIEAFRFQALFWIEDGERSIEGRRVDAGIDAVASDQFGTAQNLGGNLAEMVGDELPGAGEHDPTAHLEPGKLIAFCDERSQPRPGQGPCCSRAGWTGSNDDDVIGISQIHDRSSCLPILNRN
jgi:hypothetical protein